MISGGIAIRGPAGRCDGEQPVACLPAIPAEAIDQQKRPTPIVISDFFVLPGQGSAALAPARLGLSPEDGHWRWAV